MKTPLFLTFVLGIACCALALFLGSSDAAAPSTGSSRSERSAPPRGYPDDETKMIARLERRIAELEADAVPTDERKADSDEGGAAKIVKVFGGGGESQIDLDEIREHLGWFNQVRVGLR